MEELERQEQADRYRSTMSALRQQEQNLPVYSGSYDAEINELFGKIVNRPAFSYTPSADPLYGAYRERYVTEGRAAMRDTMSQAASLTGGYGSTYAQTAGQQQFQSYLSRLNDVLPELYSAAYTRYKDEGTELRSRMNDLAAMDSREYTRHRDAVGDDLNERKMQSSEFDRLAELIYVYGYEATEDDLKKAGMSGEQAKTIRAKYCTEHGLNPDGTPPRSSGGEWYDSTYATRLKLAQLALEQARKNDRLEVTLV